MSMLLRLPAVRRPGIHPARIVFENSNVSIEVDEGHSEPVHFDLNYTVQGPTLVSPIAFVNNPAATLDASVPGVLSVDIDASGFAAGAVAVVVGLRAANANSASVTIDFTVVAEDPDPPEGFTQAGTFESFVSGTGSRLVSSAVLFPPGVMASDNLDNFRITVSGVEQAIYVEDHGVWRHPDGSLRAVLVQTQQTLTFGTPLAMQIEVGTARNKANDLTKTSISLDLDGGNYKSGGHPQAVCNFPKEYLCTCGPWVGYDLRWQGISDGLEESYDANFFTDFELFTLTGGTPAQESGFNLDPYAMYKAWDGESASGTVPFLQYDAGFIHMNHWLMTGDARHLKAGINYAAWECYEKYSDINGQLAVWMVSPMQYMATFMVTGDTGVKTKLGAIASHHFAAGTVPGGGLNDFDNELRPIAFRILAGYACHMSGITSVDWKARTDTYLAGWDSDATSWITTGPNAGAFWNKAMYSGGCTPLANDAEVVHNFFIAILVPTLLEYQHVYGAALPSGIDDRVEGLLEYLRLTQYRPTGGPSACTDTPDFQYQNNNNAVACEQAGTASDRYDQNGLYAATFRMAGYYYNNSDWKSLGETMLHSMQIRTHRGCGGGGNGPYYFSPRTLQECYRWFYAAYSLRD